MRRRPMEIWWIAAYSAIKCVELWPPATRLAVFDQSVLVLLSVSLVLSAGALVAFARAARWSAFVLLGVSACSLLALAHGVPQGLLSRFSSLLEIAFCGWMMFYLSSESTRRLSIPAHAASSPHGSHGLVFDLLAIAVAALAAVGLRYAGLQPTHAAYAGLNLHIICGVFLDNHVRRFWMEARAHASSAEIVSTTAALREIAVDLRRENITNACDRVEELQDILEQTADGRLMITVVRWRELLSAAPEAGRDCVRRLAFDHDWKPGEVDRKRMLTYVECAPDDEFVNMVDARASFIDVLVDSGSNPASIFYPQADQMLSRITGETFAFNTPEAWTFWWKNAGPNWRGDAGTVALTARMLRLDPAAACAMARRIAGRAEEPLLRELTAQIVFLNALHKTIRERGGVEPFVRQPQRMLLVPELTDAVGLLHVDSQVLGNLGLSMQAVARRMQVRVQLVDYIRDLWRRFPNELGNDMPWLLKTLTGKHLGVLRARDTFESWWPTARESLQRFDRAIAAGLLAHAAEDHEGEERAFGAALREQPRSLCSRYNLALCAMRRNEHTEAARLLRELIALEPKEPFWWIVLGVIHRNVNKSADAHAAFRRALELGAAGPRVALQVGLTLARDRRDADAIKQLDRALGANPPASRIEAFVSLLESEGLWSLAGHYRDEAFRRGLTQGDSDLLDPDGDLAA